MATDTAQRFIDRSRQLITASYMPRIERSLTGLSDEQIWWRANADSNSIGNLLLHLAGNVRQWIVSGVAGASDVRRRQQEFDDRGPTPASELMAQLKSTVEEADRILAGVPTSTLADRCQVQGRDVSKFDAIFTVVEHFSMHTGQIILLAKTWKGDLGFYDTSGGTPKPTFVPKK
jgi:uncharacterized damage-inducible protein DinB